MLEKNKRDEYCRLLDEEIAVCMQELSGIDRPSNVALSSHASAKRQRPIRKKDGSLEYTIVEDIEQYGYRLMSTIPMCDGATVFAYVKEYEDVSSQIFMMVKPKCCPYIAWIAWVRDLPVASPHLSQIELVQNSSFKIVGNAEEWARMKTRCIYQYEKINAWIRRSEEVYQSVENDLEDSDSELSKEVSRQVDQYITEEEASERRRRRGQA